MLLFSILFPLFLAIGVKSLKTIEITAANGKFIPQSVVADIGDIVLIRGSDPFVITEGQTTAPCSEASTKRLVLRNEAGNAFSDEADTSCPSRSQVTLFTIPDTKPIVVFSAIDGQCLDGMILDINFRSSPFQPNISTTTAQYLSDSTASSGCIQTRISKQPTSRLAPRSTATEGFSTPGIIMICIVSAFLLFGTITVATCLCIQRSRRRRAAGDVEQSARAQAERTNATNTNPPPAYSVAGVGDSHVLDSEREPLTAKDVEAVPRPSITPNKLSS